MLGLRASVRGPGEARGGGARDAELQSVRKSHQSDSDQVLLITAKPHSRVPLGCDAEELHRIPRNLPLH